MIVPLLIARPVCVLATAAARVNAEAPDANSMQTCRWKFSRRREEDDLFSLRTRFVLR